MWVSIYSDYLASIQSRAQIIVISGTSKEIRDGVVELGRALGLSVYASIPKPIDLSALTEMLTHIQTRLQQFFYQVIDQPSQSAPRRTLALSLGNSLLAGLGYTSGNSDS
jgi:hypothetical protein